MAEEFIFTLPLSKNVVTVNLKGPNRVFYTDYFLQKQKKKKKTQAAEYQDGLLHLYSYTISVITKEKKALYSWEHDQIDQRSFPVQSKRFCQLILRFSITSHNFSSSSLSPCDSEHPCRGSNALP